MLSETLFCIASTAETGRFVPDGGVAVHPCENPDRRSLVLPARSAQYALRAGLWPFRIVLGAFLVIPVIVPILDPLPDIAVHIIQTIRTLSSLVTADRH